MEKERAAIEKQATVNSDFTPIKDHTLVTELHFELLKQYAWLSSVIIGAVVILIQLKIIVFEKSVFIPLVFVGVAIVNSLFAQDYIVESLSKGKTIQDIIKPVYYLRMISIFCLGLGSGMLVVMVFSSVTG